jgi:hypothetical protein
MNVVVVVAVALAEVAAAAILLFGVDWGDYKAKRREADAIALRTNRIAELKREIDDDYRDRQLRMDKGQVANVRADMAPRFLLQEELAKLVAQEKQPLIRDDTDDRKYFLRKCVAAGLVILGVLVGLFGSSLDDKKDSEPQAYYLVPLIP